MTLWKTTSRSEKMLQKAPKTVALLDELATLRMRRGWTYDDLRIKLNRFLAKEIPETEAGRMQLLRWLGTYKNTWCEPRAEIILAVQSLLEQEN